MATKVTKTIPKISVKIWRPILNKLERKLDSACIRRDAYLAKLLDTELPYLDSEISMQNSQESYDYVASELDNLDRKLVSLALPTELTTRLNEICSRKRIVRDAFFNRLFLLLAASPKLIDKLLFDSEEGDWRGGLRMHWFHEGISMPVGFDPLEEEINPFWTIREGINWSNGKTESHNQSGSTNNQSDRVESYFGHIAPIDSLYSRVFSLKIGGHALIGLSCHIPDYLVPGHSEEKQFRQDLDDMLGL